MMKQKKEDKNAKLAKKKETKKKEDKPKVKREEKAESLFVFYKLKHTSRKANKKKIKKIFENQIDRHCKDVSKVSWCAIASKDHKKDEFFVIYVY